MAKKKFLTTRTQIAIAGVGLWLLLACWTISAFWDHIGQLKLDTQFGAKCGAMAGEFALLCLVLWHCYSKHIGVRKWSLILGFILSAFLLVHAGALYGMKEAQQKADEAAGKVAKALGDMSAQQTERIGKTATRHNAVTAAKQQGEVSKNAQKIVAESVVDLAGAAKESSILPLWYLNGWMYSALFIISLLMTCIVVGLMQNQEDIDEDFDGKPDKDQNGNEFGQRPQPSIVQPQATAFDGEGNEWVMMGDGNWDQTEGRIPYPNKRSINAGMVSGSRPRANFVTRHDSTNDATQPSDATRDATQKGIDIVRDALRELAKPGHFYFKAEEKSNGVLIRQCAGVKGREEVLASYLVRSGAKLLAFAVKHRENLPYITASLKTMLIREGFNLEKDVK